MEKGNDGLLRDHGGLWRLLADVQRRLIPVLAFVLVFACSLAPGQAHASTNPSYDFALQQCQDYSAWYLANNSMKDYPSGCITFKTTNGTNYVGMTTTCRPAYPNCGNGNGADGHPAYRWKFTGTPPPTDEQICSARPSRPGIMGSNLSVCVQGCMYKPTNPLDGMDGGLKTCVAGVGGACSTQATYKPTGSTCGDGPGGDNTPPPAPPAMPKLCGGGSCYDPNTGKGCALDANGNQVCIDVKPGAPGGCISSGETTLCSGNPPPTPPQDKVPDPPTDIVGSDNYGQQPINGSGGGGSVTNTTINNYNNGMSGGDGTPNNGGSAGDSGTPTGGDPAPSTSTGTPNTASGGGDCGSPPIVTGDAALAMIAKQQWLTRCKGDGSTSNDADTSVPGLEGIGDGPGPGFFKDGTLGLDKLDDTGFGSNNTCPKFPTIAIDSLGYVMDSQPNGWCEILGAVRATMPWLGAFFALLILLGGNKR